MEEEPVEKIYGTVSAETSKEAKSIVSKTVYPNCAASRKWLEASLSASKVTNYGREIMRTREEREKTPVIEMGVPMMTKDEKAIPAFAMYKFRCFEVLEVMEVGDSIVVNRNRGNVKDWFEPRPFHNSIRKFGLKNLKQGRAFEFKGLQKGKTRIWRIR